MIRGALILALFALRLDPSTGRAEADGSACPHRLLVGDFSRDVSLAFFGDEKTWNATLTSTRRPIDWCADLQQTLASTFTVEPPEQYTVKVDRVPKTVEVLPVVEKGTWTRCHTDRSRIA